MPSDSFWVNDLDQLREVRCAREKKLQYSRFQSMSHKPHSLDRALQAFPSLPRRFNEQQIPGNENMSSKGKENQHQFSSSFQVFPPASFWSVASCLALQEGMKHHRHHPAWAQTLTTSSLQNTESLLAPCLEKWGPLPTQCFWRLLLLCSLIYSEYSFGMWRKHTDALRVLFVFTSSHSLPWWCYLIPWK